jgi:hypothetical protein
MRLRTLTSGREKKRLTVPLGETSRPASASTAKIVAISLTSVFVSLALVDFDRSWESFTRRQGCFEMCTLAGSIVAIMIVRRREAKEKKEEDIQDLRSKIQD